MRVLAALLVGFAYFLGVDWPTAAQAQLVRDHDVKGLRPFHGTVSRIRRSLQPDAQAQGVFRNILVISGLAGMEDRILLRASAETDNAEATIEKSKGKEERLIFYNPEFIARLARKEPNYWFMVAVLAHEIGHHFRLHTAILGREHEFELEADYQAGFIMRRMGAKLEQTQVAFRALGKDAATSSHPARKERVGAATLGWNEAEKQHADAVSGTAQKGNGEPCSGPPGGHSIECSSGYCVPTPHPQPGGAQRYVCMAADRHCAAPGSDGANYGSSQTFDGSVLFCCNPQKDGHAGAWGQFYRLTRRASCDRNG